jgi:hypothetical protein
MNFMAASGFHPHPINMKYLILLVCCFPFLTSHAQVPDKVYLPKIQNVKLTMAGNQLAYPILHLNGTDQLELHFDDLEGGVKSYYYTWQLCDMDWSPSALNEYDYIKGFTQNRILTYRNSSVSLVRYTHYTVNLPERNCFPSRSGNYLLKVFLNGDTSQLAFTRRVLVYEEKARTGVQLQQSYDGQKFYTHQKLILHVSLNSLNIINPLQQVHTIVLQNNRWDNALNNIQPTFIRQNDLEYNSEEILFPGGREWRWLDLRSFRLQSDRVASAQYNAGSTEVFLKPDLDRTAQKLVFYRDNDGMYYNESSENLNYLWEADYANIHFSLIPKDHQPFVDKDVFVFGELSNYGLDENAKMTYNSEKGIYEAILPLKQGYYNYCYVTLDRRDKKPSFKLTEGNFWDTENNYTILVYYRPTGGRSDELIGVTKYNSLGGSTGY